MKTLRYAVGTAIYVLVWFAILYVALLFASRIVYGQTGQHGDGHAEHHDQYEQWKQPDNGASCCNNADCRPTRARMTDRETWEAWNGYRWIPIPPLKVLRMQSPDGRSHLCESNGAVFCFLPGDTKS